MRNPFRGGGSPFVRRRLAAGLLVVALAAGAGFAIAVAGGGSDDGGSTTANVPPPGAAAKSFLARIVPAPAGQRRAEEAKVPRSVARLVRRMPLRRKVAQLFVVGYQGQNLTQPIFGRVRSQGLGGVVVDRSNFAGPDQLRQQAGEFGVVARDGKQVRPFVFAQQEGGSYNALRGLPPASDPGDLRNAAQAAQQGRQAARTLRDLGVNAVIGPDIDVGAIDQGEDAFGPRVFSDDPRQVAAYANAMVRAYRRGRIFVAPEHFPGLGSATQPTEDGVANVGLSVDQLDKRDLVPFRAAFRAGAPGVVISSGMYAPDDFVTPGSVSKAVITGLLRKRERFAGVAMTDDLADPGVSNTFSITQAAVAAVAAGADIVYMTGSAQGQQRAYSAVLRAVKRRKISRSRVDEAVTRILIAKRGIGLVP